jgi:uncharacterized protein (TIGR03086 family)
VLSRALDQAGDVMARVSTDDLDLPTPCTEWTVGQLLGHLVVDPGNFATMMRGEQPDWSASPEVPESWARRFRAAADDLIHLWHQQGEAEAPVSPDWQTAEFAAHTWDLTRALGLDTGQLDVEVAERGLAFFRENLTAENRGSAFGPEQDAGPEVGPYEQLAAFAGRSL